MIETPLPMAFLDASVLYPALLRNVLMYFAVADLYHARWSARVHKEWISALLRNRPEFPAPNSNERAVLWKRNSRRSRRRLRASRGLCHAAGCRCRHVLAAARHCEAHYIVTANLRDFPAAALAPFRLVAEHPDDFLLRLVNDNEEKALAAFYELCDQRKNPHQTPREVTEIIETPKPDGNGGCAQRADGRRVAVARHWIFRSLRRERIVSTGPLNPNLPPRRTRSRFSVSRHRRTTTPIMGTSSAPQIADTRATQDFRTKTSFLIRASPRRATDAFCMPSLLNQRSNGI